MYITSSLLSIVYSCVADLHVTVYQKDPESIISTLQSSGIEP